PGWRRPRTGALRHRRHEKCEAGLTRAAPAGEKAGSRWFAPLGGAILCEAEKVVYATTPLARQSGVLAPRSRPLSQGFASRCQNGNMERGD
ncbi:MAG: hypothetical protein H7838_06065, partial [Magnetococcus sp. DMHC-8]